MPPSCHRLHATPHMFPKEPYTLSIKALDIFKRALRTGWRRLIGRLKLQVIFRKRATNYRALLQKYPVKIMHIMTLRHPVLPKENCPSDPLLVGSR